MFSSFMMNTVIKLCQPVCPGLYTKDGPVNCNWKPDPFAFYHLKNSPNFMHTRQPQKCQGMIVISHFVQQVVSYLGCKKGKNHLDKNVNNFMFSKPFTSFYVNFGILIIGVSIQRQPFCSFLLSFHWLVLIMKYQLIELIYTVSQMFSDSMRNTGAVKLCQPGCPVSSVQSQHAKMVLSTSNLKPDPSAFYHLKNSFYFMHPRHTQKCQRSNICACFENGYLARACSHF